MKFKIGDLVEVKTNSKYMRSPIMIIDLLTEETNSAGIIEILSITCFWFIGGIYQRASFRAEMIELYSKE